MRLLFRRENLRPLSLSELLTKLPWTCARIGGGLSWQHGGPAVCCAAQVLWWLSCVYLRFGAPYRWLLGAPNPLLQLKTGCGFRLPVNGCSELRTHDWVEIGVSSCCLLRVCNIFLSAAACVCRRHAQVFNSCHSCAPSQVRTGVLQDTSSTPSQDRTGDLQRVRLTS